jgi:formamidopyrimidine-DNA glycosylase
MPELPEVETVRRGLQPVLEGAVLTHVIARRPDLRFPLPKNFARRLAGRTVLKLSRRAKYLLASLDSGETLLMHLGMSGRFAINGLAPGRSAKSLTKTGDGFGPHDHIVFDTDRGQRIVYSDHRRFGLMDLFREAEGHRLLTGLGPEPLMESFTGKVLFEALRGKKSPIKAALLDQRVVAGLGNIYVCEALHRARLSPKRAASGIPAPRLAALTAHIKRILLDAIDAGGSTLRDFRQADGALGYFQHRFQVYDRCGDVCSNKDCGGTIRRIVQAGRSTFYCPRCQR